MYTLLQSLLKEAINFENSYQYYISTYFTGFDFSRIEYMKSVCFQTVQDIQSCIKMFDSIDTTYANTAQNLVYTRAQIRENPYLLINKSGDVVFEAFLRASNSTVPNLVLSLLTHYSFYPLNEIFYYKKSNFLAQSFNPESKAAIQIALSKPSHYLGSCDCCKLKEEYSETTEIKHNIDPILSTNEDVSIAYRLHLECGQMVNLYDWFISFSSILSNNTEDIETKIKNSTSADKASARYIEKSGNENNESNVTISESCESTISLQKMNAQNDDTMPPNRAKRQICYTHKDKYFDCLKKNNVETTIEAGTTFCTMERENMYKNCPQVWADYFIQINDLKIQRRRVLEKANQ
ncbi:hypothetical protein BB561_003601 [Smittium simulii]|uniref:Origin recognition complex subunit 3 winged helix C-terminal domain-containing protein n=1 Tax=Smittium simulii TaxID=133385 RepID=A0A2T9YKI7_9FUNG|nr:hypothetical protein BB561_003601 [Smittium simulii]